MTFTAGAGTRFLVTSAASQASGPALTGPLSITGGTAAANAPVLNATQTWNNAAVTFTGWQLNVTDTASNAASLLMNLQVGGTSRFSVSKDGSLLVTGSNAINVAQIRSPNYENTGIRWDGSGFALTILAAGVAIRMDQNQNFLFDDPRWRLGWSNGGGTADTILVRDAANTLAQRNGVNAQTFNLYNTFTDASNYERLAATWASNVAYIRPQNAGTGSARLFVPVTGATTVAGLPTAATAGAGARAFVTDASATTFASIVAGGGANAVPVVSNGTNWIIG